MENPFSNRAHSKPLTIFSSLICHRDVDIFMLNWFTMRVHLERGFDIPHLVLHDGTLTEQDIARLKKLPKTTVADKPVTLHPVPKPVYLAKLEGLTSGLNLLSGGAEGNPQDRSIVFDADIFFYRNWDADLRKIQNSNAIAMRDWGSSLGPNVQQYLNTFGVHENVETPNCNTGIFSTPRWNLNKMTKTLDFYLNLDDPFMIMEDQGIMFAAYQGELAYVDGIVCVITGAESDKELWDWVLNHNGAHLMGMRTRPMGLRNMIQHSLNNLPESLHIKRFTPDSKHISWGLLEYDTYNFQVPLQKVPSRWNGGFVADCMYMHGGSSATWSFPPRCTKFTAHLICMDTGLPENVKTVHVNGQPYKLNDLITADLSNGKLEIATQDGPGAHIGFLRPRVWIDRSWTQELGDSIDKMLAE